MCTLKNVDRPFTEIFSLLTPNPNNTVELKAIYQHITNAIDIILNGVQNLMDYLFQSTQEQTLIADMWMFFSLITNLVEALNWFRSNVCYFLRQQEVLDY